MLRLTLCGRPWLVDIATPLQVLYGNTTWFEEGYGERRFGGSLCQSRVEPYSYCIAYVERGKVWAAL